MRISGAKSNLGATLSPNNGMSIFFIASHQYQDKISRA